MATVATSRIGVEFKFEDGTTIIVNENDIITDLVYRKGKEELTVDKSRIRVICGRTTAYNNGPTECPPEPYLSKYVVPTQIIVDDSSEDYARIIRINIADVVSIGGVVDPNAEDPAEDPEDEEGVVVVGPGAAYKNLNDVIADSPEGTIVMLKAGEYNAPLNITKGVEIVALDENVTLTAPITVNVPQVMTMSLGKDNTDGNAVILNGVTLAGNALIDVKSADVFCMADCTMALDSDKLTEDQIKSDKAYVIKLAEVPMMVCIENNQFTATAFTEKNKCYNGIECLALLKDGSSFSYNIFEAGWITHNSVNLYNAQNDANIQVRGNKWAADAYRTRIGFKGDPHNVNVVYADNEAGDVNVDSWGGLVLLQPYGAQTTGMSGVTLRLENNSNEYDADIYLYGSKTSMLFTADKVPTVYLNGERVQVPGPQVMERAAEGWEKGWDDPTYQENLKKLLDPATEVSSTTSFKEALTSADGGVVRLTAPISLTEKITVSGDVTLDLNDQGLAASGTSGMIVVNGGTLTLTGTGTVKNNDTYVLQASNNGKIVVEDGVTVESGGAATVVLSGAVLELNGGTIKNNNTAKKQGVQAQKVSTVVMNSGMVEGTDYGIKVLSGSNAVISGGTVKGATGAIYGSNTTTGASSIEVTGGTIDGTTGFGVALFDNLAFTLDGGNLTGAAGITINGNPENDKASIVLKKGNLSGTNCGVYLPNGTMTVEDGVEIMGPSGIVVRGGVLRMAGGTVISTSIDTVNTGDAGYAIPAAAIAIDKNAKYSSGRVDVNITGGTISASGTDAKAISYTEEGVLKEDQESYTGISVNGAKITGTVFGK